MRFVNVFVFCCVLFVLSFCVFCVLVCFLERAQGSANQHYSSPKVINLEKVSECSDAVQDVFDPDHVLHEAAFVPDDDFLGSFLPRQQTAMVCPLSVGKKRTLRLVSAHIDEVGLAQYTPASEVPNVQSNDRGVCELFRPLRATLCSFYSVMAT